MLVADMIAANVDERYGEWRSEAKRLANHGTYFINHNQSAQIVALTQFMHAHATLPIHRPPSSAPHILANRLRRMNSFGVGKMLGTGGGKISGGSCSGR